MQMYEKMNETRTITFEWISMTTTYKSYQFSCSNSLSIVEADIGKKKKILKTKGTSLSY